MAAARAPLKLTFRGRSTLEIEAARKWRIENLGKARAAEMDAEIHAALKLLVRFPGAGSLVAGSETVRWWFLDGCGYHLYYRELPGELRVVRFWHHKRRPPNV